MERCANIASISFGILFKRNGMADSHWLLSGPEREMERERAIQLNLNLVQNVHETYSKYLEMVHQSDYLSFKMARFLLEFTCWLFCRPNSFLSLILIGRLDFHSWNNWHSFEWFIEIFHLPTFYSIYFANWKLEQSILRHSYTMIHFETLISIFGYINKYSVRNTPRNLFSLFFVWHVRNYFDDNVHFFPPKCKLSQFRSI